MTAATRTGPPDVLDVDGSPWTVTRAWPRSATQVLFECARPDGSRVAARWFADHDDAAAATAATPGTRRVGGAVLHLGGADRRLPELARLVTGGAGTLVAHRPERRAVVRTPSGYRKLVRAGRAAELARRHGQLADAVAGTARVPSVTAVHDDGVELAALPGTDLRRRGSDPGDAVFVAAWSATGRVLAALGAGPGAAAPHRSGWPDLPIHDAGAEATLTHRAVTLAVDAGRLPARDVGHRLVDLVDGRDGGDVAPVVAHRDLHEGQVLVADDGTIGLLDPDTLALAEPALDLANLLAHLELRVRQGRLTPERQRVAGEALVTAAAPRAATLARLPVHLAAARLRLCAVHAWRPPWREVALRWWDELTR